MNCNSCILEKKIFIFEPILASFNIIKAASTKYKNWILINKAVGSEEGKSEINITKNTASSSILPLDTSKSGKYLSDSLEKTGKEEITITTLDIEIPPAFEIDILKLDVQGFEMQALMGSTNTLKRTLVVVMEVSNHEAYVGAAKYYEIDLFMRNNGFELFDLLPSLKENLKLFEWDAIYLNSSKIL